MSDEPTPRLDQTVEGTRQPNFKDEPRFPATVLAAGVIWIVLGCVGVLGAGALLLAFPGSFESSVAGVGLRTWACLCSPIVLLFGVLFLLAGARIVRGAENGTLANGVSSIAIGALFLINIFNAFISLVDLAYLPASFSRGLDNGHSLERDIFLMGPQLVLGLLLLTAGRLALAGGSQYKLWRDRQIDHRRREAPERKV